MDEDARELATLRAKILLDLARLAPGPQNGDRVLDRIAELRRVEILISRMLRKQNTTPIMLD